MERGKRESLSRFFGGAGFYIALLLCVLATGVVGYHVLFGGNSKKPDPVQQPDQTVVTPTAPTIPPVVDVDNGGQETPPVEVTKPVEIVIPEDDTLPTPPPVTEPVMAEPPSVIVRPLAGEVVAAFSGDELVYNQTMADWRTHGGIDITAEAGAGVAAACAGTVLAVEEDPRLGVMVTIGHGGGYETIYASLQEEVLVAEGDWVSAGQAIGTVGNTTLTESGLGAHLHFSVTKDGEAVDPEEYLA